MTFMKKFFFALSCLFQFTFHSQLLASSDGESSHEVGTSFKSCDQDTPIAMANLDTEPSAFIHGCVNVITGQFSLSETDLIVPHGVNPIKLDRNFAGVVSGKGTPSPGWFISHHSFLRKGKTSDEGDFVVQMDTGSEVPFKKSKESPLGLVHAKSLKKGITNNASGYICGQTNIKNYMLTLGHTKKSLRSGDGSSKVYDHVPKDNSGQKRLVGEYFPSGNHLVYEFARPHKSTYLDSVTLYNSEQNPVGKLSFPSKRIKSSKDGAFYTVTTQDGRWAKYKLLYAEDYGFNVLRSAETSESPIEHYYYKYTFITDGPKYAILKKREKPENRYVYINYFEKGHNPVPTHDVYLEDRLDPRIQRVKSLYAPAGTDGTGIPIYQFVYDLNVQPFKENSQKRNVLNGSCEVYNALGYRSQYVFNENHRLDCVYRFDKNNQYYTNEHMQWGNENSKDKTNLIAHALDHLGHGVVFVKTYQYDFQGNVTRNDLYGNLSGHAEVKPLIPVKGQMEQNGAECYSKTYVYSTDGYNLLLEETDGIKRTAYKYENRSNRLRAKFEGTPQKWFKRHFYTYNEDAAVTKEIVDDGSCETQDDLRDVTERHITYLTQSKSYPAAFPIIIEQKCLSLETGEEILVHKVCNTYNNLAKITKQDHYDAKGEYVYSLSWEYDAKANPVQEVDAMGRVTTRKYDINKNCIEEQGPNAEYYKSYAYDFMNRLIREEEIHADGTRHAVTHRYDVASRLIATVDAYGNETCFDYDAHGRVTETIYPLVYDERNQAVHPKIKKDYDPMGNVTLEIDPKGNETRKSYTLRGQVAEIQYPDGTSESKRYALNGFLTESVSKIGVKTVYENDYLGRVLKATSYTQEHGEINIETSYNAFHKLKEKDAQGIITNYSYYPDGKLKSKEKGESLETYHYDALGRLIKTHEYFGSSEKDYLVKAQDYDLLNRVIEERVEDCDGDIKTRMINTYDQVGNLVAVTTFPNNTPSITTTQYDSHGTPVVVTDALGNKCFTQVYYDHMNTLGQYVGYTETVDAEGNITAAEQDAICRTHLLIKKNAFGKILQKEEKLFDLNSNCCLIKDIIFEGEEEKNIITTLMEYDLNNRLIALYEAAGTPEQKVTKTVYNLFGLKDLIIKGDGTVLKHHYDLLGRITSLVSSDGTISYEYIYDHYSRHLATNDLVNHTTSQKEYDGQGRLVKERLANGLILSYSYDRMGRTLAIVLPDATGIAYEYDSCFMKSVQRIDERGQKKYAHSYDVFDLSGRLIQSTLIGEAGVLNYTYDLTGRSLKTSHDKFSQVISKYDTLGNIQAIETQNGEALHSHFAYDDLNQVIEEDGKASHAYCYDSHYNRTGKDGVASSYNALHELIEDGKFSYSYDLNGNLISKESLSGGGISTYRYDALDRMIQFETNALTYSYTYDDTDRRLTKTLSSKFFVNHSIEHFCLNYVYHGQNEIGVCDKGGCVKELRLLGVGRGAEIGASVAMEVDGAVYAPLHDQTGSVACLIEAATGDVKARYSYTSFGEELFKDALVPWRFSSKRQDAETGFVYFGRRYYSPETGRWTTQDPSGRDGGINLYGYVLNNPLSHIDLYGLFGQPADYSNYWASARTSFGSYASAFCGYAKDALKLPGIILGLIGTHLSPHPVVQKVLEFAGHCLRGENPSAFVPTAGREQPQLLVHEGSSQGNPYVKHLFFNGILNSEIDVRDELASISKKCDGVTVYGMYTPSQGLVLDLLGTLCQKIGIPTQAQAAAQHEINQLIDSTDGFRHHGMFLVEAHSRGCEIVHNLCSHIKQLMFVDSYGPARVLNSSEYKGLRTHLAISDLVTPLADPIGLIRGLLTNSIHFVGVRGFFLNCHNFSGETYLIWRNYYKELHKLAGCF